MKRSNILDLLKGIAIIAVILYHLELLTFGYLGVEIFLVIGGYLITKSILRSNDNYWTFINKRLVRLWPLLLLISAIGFGLGWLWMLPIHFKLNCEAIVGTSTFTNNIVQYITSGNYWNSDNGYKPLMHTWYVGIMMQFYLLYPLLFVCARKLSKDWIYVSFASLSVVFALSLSLFCSSFFTTEQNFYFLPSRLFEFAAGGMVALYSAQNDEIKRKKCIGWFMSIAILLTLFLLSNQELDSKKVRLIFAVVTTTIFVILADNNYKVKWLPVLKPIALCGTASYSLYLCHQVIFGFYRYAFNDQFTLLSYTFIIIFALVAGFTSFYLLEKPIGRFTKGNMKRIYTINGTCVFVALLISFVSYHYFKSNGLVRDIPELSIYVGKNSETPEDYNGRVHKLDKDFETNGRKNVLVIGDSFGRDWMNVLIESGVDSVFNMSYHTDPDKICIKRIKTADYVFIANNTNIFERYAQILPLAMEKKFYRVGRKSYGSWIGIVYNNDRYGKEYYSQKVPEKNATIETSNSEKIIFGDKFIDLMSCIKDDNGMINLFYGDGKLITQDGIHITKAGAQMYAHKLNVWQYFK